MGEHTCSCRVVKDGVLWRVLICCTSWVPGSVVNRVKAQKAKAV